MKAPNETNIACLKTLPRLSRGRWSTCSDLAPHCLFVSVQSGGQRRYLPLPLCPVSIPHQQRPLSSGWLCDAAHGCGVHDQSVGASQQLPKCLTHRSPSQSDSWLFRLHRQWMECRTVAQQKRTQTVTNVYVHVRCWMMESLWQCHGHSKCTFVNRCSFNNSGEKTV